MLVALHGRASGTRIGSKKINEINDLSLRAGISKRHVVSPRSVPVTNVCVEFRHPAKASKSPLKIQLSAARQQVISADRGRHRCGVPQAERRHRDKAWRRRRGRRCGHRRRSADQRNAVCAKVARAVRHSPPIGGEAWPISMRHMSPLRGAFSYRDARGQVPRDDRLPHEGGSDDQYFENACCREHHGPQSHEHLPRSSRRDLH